MLELLYAPKSRSIRGLWALEEVGCPYRLTPVPVGEGVERDPRHLAANPSGKVPVLLDGETAVAETGAICLYLAETFPESGLAPPIGDPARGAYLRWMLFASGPIEAAMADALLERSSPNFGVAWPPLDQVLSELAARLGGHEFIVGEHFSAADIMVATLILFGLGAQIVPPEPVYTDYVARLGERQAMKRAAEIDSAG